MAVHSFVHPSIHPPTYLHIHSITQVACTELSYVLCTGLGAGKNTVNTHEILKKEPFPPPGGMQV